MIFHVVEYEDSKKGNIVSNIQGLQLIILAQFLLVLTFLLAVAAVQQNMSVKSSFFLRDTSIKITFEVLQSEVALSIIPWTTKYTYLVVCDDNKQHSHQIFNSNLEKVTW